QRPILRIPTLAIHLNRDVNSKGFLIDEQNHLPPIFGFAQSADEDALRKLLVHEFGRQGLAVKPSEIAAFDLQLVDLQPSSLGGKDEEWVFAPRIDNLASCHAALSSLVEAASQVPMLEPTRVVALWDNEECGSTSMQGARGTLLRGILTRVISARGGNIAEDVDRSLSRSLLVSVDMAHAIHPNYPDRHDREHAPVLGKGPVIKSNANQSYATDAVSSARFVRACRSAGFTPQRFVVRSDLPCGSTIGPIVAALTGIKTVDVGNPMLSMHSIREMAACADHAMLIDAIGHLLRLDEKKRKGRKIRLVS
ncbi:MAG TPA: M18 family aminopeptidase, partial [Polyangiaceae bacterium]|nr:M18 family aminopeptidase [Polyangiaceae bacterium]